MKVSVAEDHGIVFEDVYSGFTMRTSEGNEIHICMRDDTFEINVCPKGADIQNWKRVNMQTGKIVDVKEESDKYFKEKDLKDDSVDCLCVAMLKNDIFDTGTSEEIKKHWMQSDQKIRNEQFINMANSIITNKGYCESKCGKCPFYKNGKCIVPSSPYEDMGEIRERKVAFAEDYLKEKSIEIPKGPLYEIKTFENIVVERLDALEKNNEFIKKASCKHTILPVKHTVQKCHIIYMESIVDMDDAINAYLKAGWKMEGELGLSECFTQKMVREEEE